MNDLEQRLRRDLKDLSERAGPDSIRPLRVPAVRRRSRAVRWLAPVAAVAAVIGVIVGVSVASQPAGQGHGEPLVIRPATSPEPAGTMPLYYVTAYQSFGAGSREPATFAAVHDSATGATLTTVRMPTLEGYQGDTEGPDITAAGDDRTFVITESATMSSAAWNSVSRFYLLRVAADGRSASLRLLPVSIRNLMVDGVALSPDGSKLAVAAQRCQGAGRCQFTGIRVITLATGAAADWTAQASGAVYTPSWAGDDYLAFEWESAGGAQGYRLLDVAGTGGDLLAGPAIASPAPVAADGGYTAPALITADGEAVITTAISNVPDGNRRDTVTARIVELSAATGQLLKVLYKVTTRNVTTGTNVANLDQGCQVLSLGPTGVQPLADCFSFGRVEGGKLTPLAGFPSPSASGIAGQSAAAW
jgi:hypothetical protein